MVKSRKPKEEQEEWYMTNNIIRAVKEHGKYYIFKNDVDREPIINRFNIYIRNKRKVVLDANQMALSETYRNIFSVTYLYDLIHNSSRFVLYHEGIGWTTENASLNVWQIIHDKHFPVYYRALFENSGNIKCGFCERTDIVYICGHCSELICAFCFVEWRDIYYKYNNFFRCRKCKGINFWKDEDLI